MLVDSEIAILSELYKSHELSHKIKFKKDGSLMGSSHDALDQIVPELAIQLADLIANSGAALLKHTPELAHNNKVFDRFKDYDPKTKEKIREYVVRGRDFCHDESNTLFQSFCADIESALFLSLGELDYWDHERDSKLVTEKPQKDQANDLDTSKRYLITTAQNNSQLDAEFWKELLGFKDLHGCELIVLKTQYTKDNIFGSDPSVYASQVTEFLRDGRLTAGDRMSICAESRINPTAVNPLSSMEGYTGRHDCAIFPHVKQQVVSIPVAKSAERRQLFTTGSCTLPNYKISKAGQKAEAEHVIGAITLEFSETGSPSVNQIQYKGGKIAHLWNEDQKAAVIVGGDLHSESIDQDQLNNLCKLIQVYDPDHVVVHDLFDQAPRNHHNIDDPFFRLAKHHQRAESMEDAIIQATTVLWKIVARLDVTDRSNLVIVRSNHDQALNRWVKEQDGRFDPINFEYWSELSLGWIRYIRDGGKNSSDFNVLQYAMENLTGSYYWDNVTLDDYLNIHWLAQDEPYMVLGADYGQHGNLGSGGAKGTPQTFRKAGMNATTGHTHACGLIGGVFTVGHTCLAEMGYNKGLSAWSFTHQVTFDDGSRTLVTFDL